MTMVWIMIAEARLRRIEWSPVLVKSLVVPPRPSMISTMLVATMKRT